TLWSDRWRGVPARPIGTTWRARVAGSGHRWHRAGTRGPRTGGARNGGSRRVRQTAVGTSLLVTGRPLRLVVGSDRTEKLRGLSDQPPAARRGAAVISFPLSFAGGAFLAAMPLVQGTDERGVRSYPSPSR